MAGFVKDSRVIRGGAGGLGVDARRQLQLGTHRLGTYAWEGRGLEGCDSQTSAWPESPGGLVKLDCWAPPPEFLILSVCGGAWEVAFLTSFQAVLDKEPRKKVEA